MLLYFHWLILFTSFIQWYWGDSQEASSAELKVAQMRRISIILQPGCTAFMLGTGLVSQGMAN